MFETNWMKLFETMSVPATQQLFTVSQAVYTEQQAHVSTAILLFYLLLLVLLLLLYIHPQCLLILWMHGESKGNSSCALHR